MGGFNPWIDVGVVSCFMAMLIVAMCVCAHADAKKKRALRGATRVSQ